MEFFPDAQTFINIGNVSIRWYAILIMTGVIFAYLIIKKDVKEMKFLENTDFFDDLFIISLWAGIIGARLWYCIFYPTNYYFEHLDKIIRIWDGGLAIHGGLIVGASVGIIYCLIKKVSYIRLLDAIFPQILLVQSIGRWGNFVNQEAHGPEVSEEYFNGILFFLKDGMNINGHYYMPMFFYESVACLLGFLIIRFVLRKIQRKRGELFYAYCMWYGIVRLYIESFRTDSLMVGNLKIAQVISFGGIIIGILGYLGIFEKIFKKLKTKPVILFDYDSTLMDTKQSIIDGFKYLFEKYDKIENFTKEVEKQVDGPALRDVFPILFPNEDVEKLIPEYQEVNKKSQETTLKMIKNTDVVLKTLKEKGYKVGIVSSRNKESIQRGLKKFDLDGYIDDIFGVNEIINRKPNPEGIRNIILKNKWNRSDVVLIGDSNSDIESGYNYGAFTIAYHANPEKDQDLINSKANRQIYDLIEILDILKEDTYFTYLEK